MKLELPGDLGFTRSWGVNATICSCLGAWLLAMCFLPDPRPLSAPDIAVKAVRSIGGMSEPTSRVVASVTLRVITFVVLGVLTAFGLSRVDLRWAIPLGLALAVAFAIFSQWVNYGYFPVFAQTKISVPSAIGGVLIGFAIRRSGWALAGLVALGAGLFFWGTSTRMTDDLEATARLMVQHILNRVDEIRSGDEGFADAINLVFVYAEDNSHRTDPLLSNKAAILALGIIFGDDNVAKIARKELEPEWQEPIAALRQRVTLRGRGDTPRHFWVSAGLVVIMDETRATTIGTSKELLDSFPGGSGFSFVDLAANRAGILFALAATRNTEAAKATQRHILWNTLRADDFCPEIEDLPEGLSRDKFQADYGGLAGRRTKELMATIDERMARLPVLQ